GEHRLHEVETRLHVVALDDDDRRRDVEVRERLPAARLPEARLERSRVDVRPVGRVPDRQPAVGDLGGLLDALRADRGDVDRDLPAVENAPERLAEPGRVGTAVRDVVVSPLVLERPLARPDRADDRDVLARPYERLPEREAVPSLDDLRSGHAEPEKE